MHPRLEGGYTEGTQNVSVTVNVLEYYKIFASPTSISFSLDPGIGWETFDDDSFTLGYFACIAESTTSDVSVDLDVTSLQSYVTRMHFRLYEAPYAHPSNQLKEWTITTTGLQGSVNIFTYDAGDPIQNKTLKAWGTVGVGIPVTNLPVLTGNLIFTIS